MSPPSAVHGRSITPPAAHPSPPFTGDHRRLLLLTKPAVRGKPTAVRGCQKPAAIHGHCKPAAIRGQRKPAVRGYGKSAGTWFSATGHGATVGVCCTHPNPRIFLTSTGSVQPFSVSAGLLSSLGWPAPLLACALQCLFLAGAHQCQLLDSACQSPLRSRSLESTPEPALFQELTESTPEPAPFQNSQSPLLSPLRSRSSQSPLQSPLRSRSGLCLVLNPQPSASSAHSCTPCTHTTVQLHTAPMSSSNLLMTQRW